MIDRQRVTSVLTDLVRIESINPDLVPGGSGELNAVRCVVDFLQAAGVEARLQEAGVEVLPERRQALYHWKRGSNVFLKRT